MFSALGFLGVQVHARKILQLKHKHLGSKRRTHISAD
jgi:hypothetical protein